jgi:hypothetical protein
MNTILEALYAERYGPSLWWKTPEPQPDDELVCAQRRRDLANDFDHAERGAA